ncbi:hypothetical protein [Flectobacillus roseus]|uniref:Uncharacterized protein n=1 Tax=Flectobacillus roseus TaxID=502259 RepID=A0ABT6Y3U4_9BACT|nr:hypothetical protein [Flectobacillus roseus]MDI9857951.1 hypothetical protein [Flectobacillus roseus]
MNKKTISVSHKMKGGVLDDDYTLYDDGTILHEYDKNTYPGGQNLRDSLTVAELSDEVKQRLLEAASDENKELVRKTLNC